MAAGICEKCGSEPGKPHTFLYGSQVSTSDVLPTVTTTTTTYEVKGSAQALIGSRCIEERHQREIRLAWIRFFVALVVMIVAAVVATLQIQGKSMDDSVTPLFLGAFGVGCIALIAVIGSAVGVWGEKNETPEERGEEIAIELHRAELQGQGHNDFWTHEQWRLKAKTQSS